MFYASIMLVVVFLLSLISIWCVITFSHRFGFFDSTDIRKIHTGNIPRLGGIGIFVGFVLGLFLFYYIDYKQFTAYNNLWTIICSSTMIFIMGVWDDMKPWKARYKLIVQCAAALIILFGGNFFSRMTFGPLHFVWNFGLLSYPITFFWIIGVTNALNLIDGIDGLAGSIAFMAALTYAFFFYLAGEKGAALVCIILAVSVSGFLVLNLPFPKAKIFMGDGGSQFLGFSLAVLPLINASDGYTIIALPYASAVLLIPIFDTIAAIWRRVRDKRSIDSPDRLHLHHKLMMMGFSSRQVLVIIIFFQLNISILVSSSIWLRGLFALILLFTVYLMGILFFTIVHIKKNEILAASDEL